MSGEDDRYRRRLAAGELLFREGDEADCAFVIEAGTVEIYRERNGAEERLAQLGSGELLGEMALVDQRPRTAYARAATDVHLRVVSQEYLRQKLNRTDPLVRLLLRVIMRRYRSVISAEAALATEDDQDSTAVVERLMLEQKIAQALDRGEFELHYQPIVRLADYTTAGFEALIRWRKPDGGFISPGLFIPVAEQSDLIVDIGRWALREAAAAVARIQKQENRTLGRTRLFMAVNLSGRQLHPGLYNDVTEAIQAADIRAGQLKLEITESLLMENWDSAVAVLERLRADGFPIAVDDFGTGYSSLSYLHRFPVDTLKVDRSFVTLMKSDAGSKKILRAVGSLAHALGMDIVAEGVESVEQVAHLYSLGFELVQGFLFSKAVPEAQAAAMASHIWDVNAMRKL